MCADTAAVALIAGTAISCTSPASGASSPPGSSISTGEPVTVIRWKAAIHALKTGLPALLII